ncbi:MAG: AAA family ATPase [Parabacteroides sp.]|nr:AAA family ATPase [Parabacteroides sp.]
MENRNFYIFTGGPGSGKSTVLEILKNMGYLTVNEVAREIIKKQVWTGGDALPWMNTVRYANLMFFKSILDFEEFAHVDKTCFFDRGIIDTLGYARLVNIPVTDDMIETANRYKYNTKIFLFPFWKEIYMNDSERKQDQEEAQKTYLIIKDTYENFGYETINVPFLSPKERAEWILHMVGTIQEAEI